MSKRQSWEELLTPALERAWLGRLRAAWQEIAAAQVPGALRPPVFRLDRATTRLGSWQPSTRTITLAARHLALDPWDEVVATLRHEMAHQYAHEVLQERGEAPHGGAFHHAELRLGVRADAAAAADPTSQRVLQRVQKLLALAASDNPHEAEAAMARAHALLLEHNLSLGAAAPDYRALRLGEAWGALPLHAKMIAGLLTEYFFVEAVWVLRYEALRNRDLRQLEIYGRPHDVEMAEYVHDFLHAAVARLFAAARQRGEVDARGRRDYLAGVLSGFRQRLAGAKTDAAARGLVWVADGDLRHFVRERHPRLRTLGSAGARRTRAHELGRRDGAKLSVLRPVRSGAGGGLLPAPTKG